MSNSMVRKKMGALLLCMLLWLSTLQLAAAAEKFSDLQGHWAEQALQAWIDRGYLQGYADGTVQPDRPMTRAEFVTIANRVFGFKEQAAVAATDVSEDDWAYAQVAIAIKADYITGYEDGTFRPEQPVSRQEAAVMLAALKKLGGGDAAALAAFQDAGSVPPWSKPSLAAVVAQGYIAGYEDGTIRASRSVTRAEAVVMLDRVLAGAQSSATVAYDKAGTYGPSTGSQSIAGDVRIAASGVVLQNVTISGRLTLEEGIGEGDVTLRNVTVAGETSVYGGGENSVHVADSTLSTVEVSKKSGTVRIAAEGKTTAKQVNMKSSGHIDNSKAAGSGFAAVNVDPGTASGSKVKLTGSFDQLEIAAPSVAIEASGGTIKRATATAQAGGTTLTLSKDAKVGELVLNSALKVAGEGSIEKATINKGAESTTFQTAPKQKVPGTGVILGGGGGVSSAPASDPEPPLTKEYTVAGTYGPESGMETVTGNVYIQIGGITLRNMTITGNLTIGEGVGEGDVDLNNVTVLGETNVNGGGPNSIHFKDAVLVKIIVNKQTGEVRIVAEGKTSVNQVNVQSSAKVDGSKATNGGFSSVTLSDKLPEGSKVSLLGNFDNVSVGAKSVNVDVPNGTIKNLSVSNNAGGTSLTLGNNSKVTSLVLKAALQVTGQGTIENATMDESAAGSTFQQQPSNVSMNPGSGSGTAFRMMFATYSNGVIDVPSMMSGSPQLQLSQFVVKAVASGVDPVVLIPAALTVEQNKITLAVPEIIGSADGFAAYSVEYWNGTERQSVSTGKFSVPLFKVLSASAVPDNNQGATISGAVTPNATGVRVTLIRPDDVLRHSTEVAISPDGTFEMSTGHLSDVGAWTYEVEAMHGNYRSPAVTGAVMVRTPVKPILAQVAQNQSSLVMRTDSAPGTGAWLFETPFNNLKVTLSSSDILVEGLPEGLQAVATYVNHSPSGNWFSVRLTGTALESVTSSVPVTVTLKVSAILNPDLNANANSLPIPVQLLPADSEDTQGPSSVPNFSIGAVTATGGTILWGAASDNVGTVGYAVYMNGYPAGIVTTTTYTATGLTPNTQYLFRVIPVDAVGNKGEPRDTGIVTLAAPSVPDTTPPGQVQGLVTSSVTSTGATLTWMTASDDIGTVGYAVYGNGTLWGTVTGSTYNAMGLTPNTQYHIRVQAYDAAGNYGEAAIVTFTTLPISTAKIVLSDNSFSVGTIPLIQITGTGTNFQDGATTVRITKFPDNALVDVPINFAVISSTQINLTIESSLGDGIYYLEVTYGSSTVKNTFFVYVLPTL
ncbi:S-layer homology domain-containing protein [Paenibacillus sp. HJGM_3]|uniref:S-layer homology domain-containing protein n=1 Tax=Paenibacillus sp. HJGM_3 TaxID=3379816 RepID=UPI00385AF3F9